MALARDPCMHAVKIDARKVGRDIDGVLAVRHGNLARARMFPRRCRAMQMKKAAHMKKSRAQGAATDLRC
jgi:hypothetical protein